jgi:hypothetical protein
MAIRRRTRPTACSLGEVSKKDFVAIAGILCEEKAATSLKERLAGYFKSQNSRFDTGRFMRATESCRLG